MIQVTREMCRNNVEYSVSIQPGILQASLGKSVWRVAVASMLLCRTRRSQAEPVLWKLLAMWPSAAELARAEGLEEVVMPCGLHRSRTRQLTRFSSEYLEDGWEYLKELTGVGTYVHDAVGLVCFGCKELECYDSALLEFRRSTP
jgi:adenine-specific DNA glycosylase